MDEVEEFIHRRFPNDSNWLDGNCYFFAVILKSVFSGTIYYDQIEGHFIVEICNKFYDWSGRRYYDENYVENFLNWNTMPFTDIALYKRIVKDCVL